MTPGQRSELERLLNASIHSDASRWLAFQGIRGVKLGTDSVCAGAEHGYTVNVYPWPGYESHCRQFLDTLPRMFSADAAGFGTWDLPYRIIAESPHV